MNSQAINSERINELLYFLPLFDVPGREFMQTSSNGYPAYNKDVKQFFSLAAQECWCDYNYNPAETSKMLNNDELLNKATLEDIKTMLTYCIRSERFCDGTWGALLKSGGIVALLKRLEVITQSVS